MRIVIYDDESFEPVTVINLRGVAHRDILSRGRRYRVAIPPPLLSVSDICPASTVPEYVKFETVDLEFELLVRNSPAHGEQRHWMCFTKAADLAMKLNPAWLPGQRPAIDELRDQNDRLTDMVMGALMRG